MADSMRFSTSSYRESAELIHAEEEALPLQATFGYFLCFFCQRSLSEDLLIDMKSKIVSMKEVAIA
jgi:hypothetical protein